MDERELKKRRRHKKRQIRIAILFFCMLGILGILGIAGQKILLPSKEKNQEYTEEVTEFVRETSKIEESQREETTETETEEETSLPMMEGLQSIMDDAYSSNVEVIRVADETIIAQKDAYERTYPASLTKIMTTLVAIEHLENLQEPITLEAAMFDDLYEQDASLSGFTPGDTVKAIDLLYGIMLPSGAESCIALADWIAESEENFAKLMNQKAEDLGMTETHFTNASGLHNAEHYTTVHDLGILLLEALKNDTFRQIFVSRTYNTEATSYHSEGIYFEASVFKYMNEDQRMRAEGVIQGGKTGYTTEARLCLASLGVVNGEEFLVITTGADGNHETVQFNIEDALIIYEAIGAV